ncbi:MAG: hypothetical protein GXX91_12160, partial [Verrucomicrobiaceae bacterium]|nr:hypothetical protein [Verrucomicrobiaceae bacterium]
MRPLLLLSLILLGSASISAGDPPKVRVGEVRRVSHNGEHNAFTDLI